MAEQGDIEAAESYWRPIVENSAYTTEIIAYTRGLIDSRSTARAAQLVDVALVQSPTNWEFLVLGIIAHQLNHNPKAAQTLADRLLTKDLPNTTPSALLTNRALLTNQAASQETPFPASQEQSVKNSVAFDRLAWMERAAPWQVIFNQADTSESAFRRNLGNPNTVNSSLTRLQALQRGATIRTSLSLDTRINTFADARAIAVLAKLGQVNRSQAPAGAPVMDEAVLR